MEPLFLTTGAIAEGKEKFFIREDIIEKIKGNLLEGKNILIAAPRRVGKSSILKYITHEAQNDFIVKYISVMHIDDSNEYFKQLYNVLLEDTIIYNAVETYLAHSRAIIKSYIKRLTKISLSGVEFDPNEKIDYHRECLNLIHALPDSFKTIVFVIDEFPDAVENIINTDSKESASTFLQLNRDFRTVEVKGKAQFIYTGSIGLGNVLRKLQKRNLANDLKRIEVPPLKPQEATQLIERLLMGINIRRQKRKKAPLALSAKALACILKKITWLIPYYIQILLDEINDLGQQEITCRQIDDAFGEIIHNRYKYEDYFANWKERLKKALDKHEYTLAIEILNFISSQESIDKAELNDLVHKHGMSDAHGVLSVLEFDGYIHIENNLYCFNSPILKEWWFVNVAT